MKCCQVPLGPVILALEGKGNNNRSSWYRKLIQVVNMLEDCAIQIPNLSARLLRNNPTFSLIKTKANSSRSDSFLCGPGFDDGLLLSETLSMFTVISDPRQ